MAEAAFGVQLRQSRQAAALSLRQLATRVGYDHSYLSQVERGQRPGSAQLAQLCDRELNTGTTLATAFQQAKPTQQPQPVPQPQALLQPHSVAQAQVVLQTHSVAQAQSAPLPQSPQRAQSARQQQSVQQAPLVSQAQVVRQTESAPQTESATQAQLVTEPLLVAQAAPPSRAYQFHSVQQTMGVDLLEAVRHGLVESYGQSGPEDEWHAVVADLAVGYSRTPPAELLPELTAHLQLLPADGSPTHAVLATELGILVALTLTALGQSRAAGRWWWTSRTSADSSGEQLAMSLTRGWEAASGPAGSRPLGELLTLADEAVALGAAADTDDRDDRVLEGRSVLGGRSGCLAQGHAARALVLAQQGLAATAWKAVQDLLAVTVETPADHAGGLFDWPAYKVHSIEGRVCAQLGYPAAGYVVLERALELCPPGHLVERAELELCLARCLMVDGEVAAGLALAMRVLVELPDQWHTQYLYDEAGRVLSAVPGKELGRAAVRDYRELLGRRPYLNRTVGSGSSSAWSQG